MKNLQSWVETTLPPGYAPLMEPPVVGWTSGTTARWPFRDTAERNRAAWRHWTATALRGRGNLRADSVERYAQSGAIVWSWRGYRVGFKRMYVRWRHSNPDIYELGPHDAQREDVYDLDEAMARFAMYVFYAQGPVTP